MTRKELIQALEGKWGTKARYLGVPSCAYEITCGEGIFQVDRQGVIRDQDGREFSAEELLRETPAEPCEEAVSAAPDEPKVEGYTVTLPLAGHTGASLRNLVNMLASKERLLVSAFGLSQPMLDASLAFDVHQRPTEDLKSFQTVWTDLEARRSPGLEFDFATQILTMKLPRENPTEEERAAFRDMAVCMNESAKKLKFSSYKPAQEDNPKFAFRTWLLRLGMTGDAYKTTRKVLLARLSGSAAFRTPAEEEKHKARLLAKRLKRCEGDVDVC